MAILKEKCVNCYWDHAINQIVVIDKSKFAMHYAYVTHRKMAPPAHFSEWTLKIYPTNQEVKP